MLAEVLQEGLWLGRAQVSCLPLIMCLLWSKSAALEGDSVRGARVPREPGEQAGQTAGYSAQPT